MVYVLPVAQKRLLRLRHLLHFLTGVSPIIEAHTDPCKTCFAAMTPHLRSLTLERQAGRVLLDALITQQYWHSGYPSVTQLEDGTVVVAYHEYSDDEHPIQYLMCTRFKL
jgi:hypothetical protein